MVSCPVPPGSEDYEVRGTSWKPMLIASFACLVLTTGIALSLIVLHLRRYRSRNEQRQIVRIIFSVVVYSLVAAFEILSYEIAQYIDPIGDVYEAFGLCALFLLYIQYAAPTDKFDEDTLEAVRSAEMDSSSTNFDWVRISWVFVFQYPIIEILDVAVMEATEATGRYCLNSLSPAFGHIWVQVIQSISIGLCVLAILKFRGRFKDLMKVRRGLAKLLCFKGIVFLRFSQAWVFSLLLQYHVIKPSKTFSYNDIMYGIPNLATCAEMTIFALIFWYAFSSTEYSSRAKPSQRPLPVWRAALHALNPWDLIEGMIRIFTMCVTLQRSGDWKRFQVAQKDQGVTGAVRKGVRKYKARKGGDEQGRYQELDEGRDSLTQPTEMHHMRSESAESNGYSMSGGVSGAEMYQPPDGSPPSYESGGFLSTTGGRPRASSQSYLAPGVPPSGRARSSSQSSLMAEMPSTAGRPRSPSEGYWNGQRYESPLPSPQSGSKFMEEPTRGRDMV